MSSLCRRGYNGDLEEMPAALAGTKQDQCTPDVASAIGFSSAPAASISVAAPWRRKLTIQRLMRRFETLQVASPPALQRGIVSLHGLENRRELRTEGMTG